MCRWGCETTNTTFMCKWCGTWFCRECLRGSFHGLMSEPLKCRVCNQKKCQGTKVDFLIRQPTAEEEGEKKGGKSAGSARGRSASPSKSAKSAKTAKTSKTFAGNKKGAKKSGKKKKK